MTPFKGIVRIGGDPVTAAGFLARYSDYRTSRCHFAPRDRHFDGPFSVRTQIPLHG